MKGSATTSKLVSAATAAAKHTAASKVAVATPVTLAAFALTPWTILTATAGLVAFHIGLFSLVGRERKSPYVINLLFPIFLFCLLTATVAIVAALAASLGVPARAERILVAVAASILVIAFLLSIRAVYRIATRFIYFVDGISIKQLPIIRQVRRGLVMKKPLTYQHDSTQIDDQVYQKILTAITSGGDQHGTGSGPEARSLAIRVYRQHQANDLLIPLCIAFLEAGYSVQYLAASRHPIEFIGLLHEKADKNRWAEFANHLVTIDGYSPHFGFLDSIYLRKDRTLKTLGADPIPSTMTYAGLHSAASKAFNLLEQKTGDRVRKPALVIYDGCYALSDLESSEQYRVFVRHVVPSERMWSGMFTVFVETSMAAADWELLASYVDIVADLTQTGDDAAAGTPNGARQ